MKGFTRDLGFWLSRKINFPFVPPDTLQISLTNRCNLKCKMCNVWHNNNDNELSFLEVKGVIEQSAKWGIKEINLCGGEPLLKDNIFEVVRYAKTKGMKIILTTNGTLINETMARKIVDSGIEVISISLDGATAEVHDKIRGQGGAYAKIIEGIRLLSQYKWGSGPIKVLILTISNDNLDELVDYIYLAKELNVEGIYLTSLVVDNIKLYSDVKDGSMLWIRGERLKKLDEMVDKAGLIYNFDYPSFRLIKKYFRQELKKDDWSCFAGFRRFVLCPDGNVQMCGETIGNIRVNNDIKQIWVSAVAQRKRLKIKNCRNYCLQDCHARPESASLKNILSRVINKLQ